MKTLWIALLFLGSTAVLAHDHDAESGAEGERSKVGPDKGVTHADEHEGFALNERAARNFALQTSPVKGKAPWIVPASALVSSGTEKQIFRFRDGYWKAVDVELIKRDARTVTIKSPDLAPTDRIAVTGVGYLKIVEQSIFGPETPGHVH